MIDNEGDIPDAGAVPPGTTGRELREAREAKGWDIQSLSDSLHLRPSVLLAIEAGHYQGVPELFLKGYVRSYARLLGMDGDRLMPQLDAELQPLRQQEADREGHNPILHIEAKKRKKKRIAFWLLLLLLVCIVVFAVVRFQTAGPEALVFSNDAPATEEEPIAVAEEVFEGEEPRRIQLVTESEPAPVATAGDDTSPNDTTALLEQSSPDPQSGTQDSQAGAVPETPPSEPTESATTDPEGGQNSLSTGRGETVSNRDSSVAAADEDLVPPSESLTQSSGQASDQAAAEFEIEFEADCWIEIRNGAGERIYAALRTAGDTLTRSALPPVSFVIGNVNSISSFSFDGEPVDVGGYRAWNGRAEITLGSDSGN